MFMYTGAFYQVLEKTERNQQQILQKPISKTTEKLKAFIETNNSKANSILNPSFHSLIDQQRPEQNLF